MLADGPRSWHPGSERETRDGGAGSALSANLCLYFQPVTRPFTRSVWGVDAFRDDALDVMLTAHAEDVGVSSTQLWCHAPCGAFEAEVVDQCATLGVRLVDDWRAVEREDVERDERQRHMPTRSAAPEDAVEVLRAALAEDKLTVEHHGAAVERVDEWCEFREPVGQFVPVAGPHPDAAVGGDDGSPAVELRFEHPLARQRKRHAARGEHRVEGHSHRTLRLRRALADSLTGGRWVWGGWVASPQAPVPPSGARACGPHDGHVRSTGPDRYVRPRWPGSRTLATGCIKRSGSCACRLDATWSRRSRCSATGRRSSTNASKRPRSTSSTASCDSTFLHP